MQGVIHLQQPGIVGGELHVSTDRRRFVAAQGCFYFIQHSLMEGDVVSAVWNSAFADLLHLERLPSLAWKCGDDQTRSRDKPAALRGLSTR